MDAPVFPYNAINGKRFEAKAKRALALVTAGMKKHKGRMRPAHP
jgi:hypothetical protein